MNDPEETLNMFCDANKEYLVPDVEEDNIHKSESEDKMPVHVIHDMGQYMRSERKIGEVVRFYLPQERR